MAALLLLFADVVTLAVLIAGVAFWRKGRRRRHKRTSIACAVMTLVAAPLMAAPIWITVSDMATDWNPRIASNNDVRGTWSNGADTLTLGEGSAASYTSSQSVLSGQWYREDWNLFLFGPGLEKRMRFYRKWGKLRLLASNPEGDPDTGGSNAGWKLK